MKQPDVNGEIMKQLSVVAQQGTGTALKHHTVPLGLKKCFSEYYGTKLVPVHVGIKSQALFPQK